MAVSIGFQSRLGLVLRNARSIGLALAGVDRKRQRNGTEDFSTQKVLGHGIPRIPRHGKGRLCSEEYLICSLSREVNPLSQTSCGGDGP
jgi:hypothetical protein